VASHKESQKLIRELILPTVSGLLELNALSIKSIKDRVTVARSHEKIQAHPMKTPSEAFLYKQLKFMYSIKCM